jgi:hypothetical protein
MSDETPRVTSARADAEDAQFDAGLRPRVLDEFTGQDRVRENLHVSITAAKQRRGLDHVCYRPPASARRRGVRHREQTGRAGADVGPGVGKAGGLRRCHEPQERESSSSTRST